MGIQYTSKLGVDQYHMLESDAAELISNNAGFCVNCCEECGPTDFKATGDYCEACDCDSILAVEYLLACGWLTILSPRDDV